MPTVTRVTVAPYRLPLKSPLRWGSGHEMPALEHVLVRVELSDGAVGIAEANPRPTIYGETPHSVEAVIRQHIAPALVGQPVNTPEDIAHATAQYALLKNNNTARAATDMALWGALACSHNTTLAQLLGVTREHVRVSYILGTGDTDTVLREAENVYHAGIRVLKVKTGKDFDREYDLIRQIKAACPDMDCYIDANETYTPEVAAETLAAFAELGVLYCEEPLPVRQLRERAALRATETLPLIGDDSCFTLADLERELDFDTFDVLNIKPPRNGFTEGLAMVALAQAAGKGVMMGSQASSILGCIHTLMLAGVAGVEHPSEGTFWLKVDDEAALPVVDGYVSMGDLVDAHTATTEYLLASAGFEIDRTAWAILYGEDPAVALGSLMHEMRNTLTGIKGGIDIANTIIENTKAGQTIKGFSVDDIPEFLNMTVRNAEQLEALIAEIMHLRRLEPSSHFLASLAAQIPLDHRMAEFIRLMQDD
ncbi:MAG: enolase C-terminal domain-like protein, partial [Chloroflexota bacterium]